VDDVLRSIPKTDHELQADAIRGDITAITRQVALMEIAGLSAAPAMEEANKDLSQKRAALQAMTADPG
jgi:hypothetical protein